MEMDRKVNPGIATMEAGDPYIYLNLLIKSLFISGMTRKNSANAISM